MTRRWTCALALALAVGVTGCGGSGSDGKSPAGSEDSAASGGAARDGGKTTFRLGEASPPQSNGGAKAKGRGRWTVAPTKVAVGTAKELADSGLDRQGEKPEVPVFVWSTLRHQGGAPVSVRDMKSDINVKTDGGKRVGELIVLRGDVAWRGDCPASDEEKVLGEGEVEKVCAVYLVPKGWGVSAVEVSRGFRAQPLAWPIT